jgi:hypothetical protein
MSGRRRIVKIPSRWRFPQRRQRAEPERLLATCSDDRSWVWSFVLEEQDD